MPSKQPWAFDIATYNRLPRLETATRKLNGVKPHFDLFVREVSQILNQANLGNGELGAFLLHRHWNLKPRHLMVERPRILESGQVALITAAVPITSKKGSVLTPSRWSAPSTARPMVALEFSVDPFVAEIVGKLTKSAGLVQSLAKALEKHALQATVGYMVIPRKSIKVDANTDFVETNTGRISVVTGEVLSPQEKLVSIRTGWPLSVGRQGSVFACDCYCSHGPGHTCRHPKPKPPICKPHGCV